MTNQTDHELDAECYDLLDKVDALRRQLKLLEPQLTKSCLAYGKRRGCDLFREWHVRNMREMQNPKRMGE